MAINNSNNNLTQSWRKTWWGRSIIIFAILFFILIIAFGWYVYTLNKSLSLQTINANNIQSSIDKLISTGPYVFDDNNDRPHIGNPDAALKIVEFFDFNCPYCKASYPTIRRISSKYSNDVDITLRYYPILAESSVTLALAGECANEQGLFWNLHDNFFQSDDPADNIVALAKKSGLNMQQFNTCMENEKYIDRINKDKMLAEQIGARGTPTWVINGHRFDGVIPSDIFEQIINVLIKNL